MAVLRVAGSEPGSETRTFSACGAPELERRVAADLDHCVRALRARVPRFVLTAIVLGGGYGRGEGGVRRTPTPVPYNDYDLFVVTPTLPRPLQICLRVSLHRLAERLTRELGMEVELATLDLRTIEHPPETLSMADLRWRHRVLWGPGDALGRMPGPMLREIPPVEATRLLMNRSALLALARGFTKPGERRAGDDPAVAERLRRYVAKAWLASGDARLIASGRYHPSWRVRLAGLEEADEGPLALGPLLRDRYREMAVQRLEGVPHRLAGLPERSIAEAAGALAESLDVVERLRLGVGIGDREAYRRAAMAATPASTKDRVRDLRDVLLRGQPVTHTLRAPGSRSARAFARLPELLALLADPESTTPDHADRVASSFLRCWRSLP